jgi:glycosyltransferase involved in cell wall biosynthesis/GT2 family glycosyltransferase
LTEVVNVALTVLMLVNQLDVGGTETHVLSLAKQLKKEGVNVVIGTAGGVLLDGYSESQLEIAHLPFKSDNPVYSEYKLLLEKAKELVVTHSVNLIHAHSIAALKVAVQVSDETLVPTVATIHGKFYPPRRLRGLLDRCPKVIAVSSPVVNWLSKAIDYPIQQIALIPNGVDTEYFTPGEKLNPFRAELQIPEEERLAVIVSRLAWEKTRVVEAAIQAVVNLQGEFPLHLAIVGGGAHQPLVHAAARLANAAVNKEVVRVIGQRIDPLHCFQAADVVIGTARVALEALSCQRPLIAGGNASYVGYLEPSNLEKAWSVYFGDHHWAYPLTVERLTNDLRRVLENIAEAEQNAAKLREWVLANFDIKDIAKQTLQFYEDTLAGKELSSSLLPELATSDEKPAGQKRRGGKQNVPSLSLFDERPLVSVAIPAYNRGQYLEECLQSLAAQTYRPLEIVVVNDGSTDNTGEVSQNWWAALEDKDGLSFVYLALPHNTGYASAQSIAYRLSTGKLIANQDSDDISHPQRLEKQVAFLLANPDYSFVGTNFAVFAGDITKKRRSYMVRYGFERIATSYQNGGHVICFGTLLFKRALFERIGGLTSFLKGAEDYEWITRALNQGFYVDNLKEQLYYYRSHPGQLSRLVKSTRRLKRPWEYVLELGSLDASSGGIGLEQVEG